MEYKDRVILYAKDKNGFYTPREYRRDRLPCGWAKGIEIVFLGLMLFTILLSPILLYYTLYVECGLVLFAVIFGAIQAIMDENRWNNFYCVLEESESQSYRKKKYLQQLKLAKKYLIVLQKKHKKHKKLIKVLKKFIRSENLLYDEEQI